MCDDFVSVTQTSGSSGCDLRESQSAIASPLVSHLKSVLNQNSWRFRSNCCHALSSSSWTHTADHLNPDTWCFYPAKSHLVGLGLKVSSIDIILVSDFAFFCQWSWTSQLSEKWDFDKRVLFIRPLWKLLIKKLLHGRGVEQKLWYMHHTGDTKAPVDWQSMK